MNGVALVTGGTRGIGWGIAQSLAQDGWKLALCARGRAEDVAGPMETLASQGREALYVQADVSVDADRRRLIAAVRERFGRLDALVNNAGVAPRQRVDLLEAEEADLDRLFTVNVKSGYLLTQLAARWMIESKIPGSILFLGSVSATVASVDRGGYCLSKAAVAMSCRLWAARLAEYGISVYELRPGIISTDMTAGVRPKYDALIQSGRLLQPRWGTPADVGRAAAMLLRGDLPYATGQVLVQDGGWGVERL